VCEDHFGSHNGSVASAGANPQKQLAQARKRIRVRLAMFAASGTEPSRKSIEEL
jgi:hypothetical protein